VRQLRSRHSNKRRRSSVFSKNYDIILSVHSQALFPITLEAMKSENDQVALQGIEFWSNVCDEEIDLAIESQEPKNAGQTPEHMSRHYARGAL